MINVFIICLMISTSKLWSRCDVKLNGIFFSSTITINTYVKLQKSFIRYTLECVIFSFWKQVFWVFNFFWQSWVIYMFVSHVRNDTGSNQNCVQQTKLSVKYHILLSKWHSQFLYKSPQTVWSITSACKW